jgi:protein TonB
MMALSAEDLADLRRWVMCGAVIVFAHGGIAAGMVNWREEIEPAEPAAAIVIEFALVPVAPAAPQTEIPPGPEQVMSDASPNKPVESLEEKQKVEDKVASKPVEEPPPETPIRTSQSSPLPRRFQLRSAKNRARRHRRPPRRRRFQIRPPRSLPPPRRAGSPQTIRTRCRRGKRRLWRCSSATSAIRR